MITTGVYLGIIETVLRQYRATSQFRLKQYMKRGNNDKCIHSKSWWPWWPDSANFFHFPPKFRLRTWKPSRLNCTNASPSVCRLCFVFNIPTSYIDLLYFDNLLLKTPDLCNLPTFVAIFLLQFTHFFRQFLEAKKTDSANLSAFRMYAKNYAVCRRLLVLDQWSSKY